MTFDPHANTTGQSAARLLLDGSGHEEIVVQALQECQAAIDAGQSIDREAMLGKYPEIREELSACLDGLELMRQPAKSGEGVHEKTPSQPQVTPLATLGDFRIVRELGRGGMGVVYEAEQLSIGRRVALKVLPYASMLDKRQIARFQNEARAAATLEHPHIVPVYFVGNERGVYYYAMRLIEGKNLSEVLVELRGASKNEAPLSQIASQLTNSQEPQSNPDEAVADADTVKTAVNDSSTRIASEHREHGNVYFQSIARIGQQAAEALEFAHSHGIIHRDVKPANIMLDEVGDAWIADFGLARIEADGGMTMSGDLIGTLHYMSPEQTLAKRVTVDHRSDVYSLGASLYELVTLQPLFDGDDRASLLRKIAFEEPKPPSKIRSSVPHDLETIILKSLRKNSEDRYATAQEFADDLQRFLSHEPVKARRTPLTQRFRMWTRRHPAISTSLAVLTTVVLLSVAIIGVLVARQEHNLRTQEEQAGEQIQASLSEKEDALHIANANLDEALNAIDHFLVELSGEAGNAIPPASPLRQDLIRSAFEIYQRLEATDQMTSVLEKRKLATLLRAAKVPGLDESLCDQIRNATELLVDRILAKSPHNQLANFAKIDLLLRKNIVDVQSKTKQKSDILELVRSQVSHWGSATKMFEGQQDHYWLFADVLRRSYHLRDSYNGAPLTLSDWRFFIATSKQLILSGDASHPYQNQLAELAYQTANFAETFGDDDESWELFNIARDLSDSVLLPTSFAANIKLRDGEIAAIDYCEQQLLRHEAELIKYPHHQRNWQYWNLQQRLARLLIDQPDLQARIDALEKETARQHPLIRRNVLLAELHRHLGNNEKAIHYYEEAEATNFGVIPPTFVSPPVSLYKAKGDYDSAIRIYSSHKDPHIVKQRAELWYRKAISENDDEAFDMALHDLELAVRRAPKDGSNLYWGRMHALDVGLECKHEGFKSGMADLAALNLEIAPESWSYRQSPLNALVYLGFHDRALKHAISDEERQIILAAKQRLEQRIDPAISKTEAELNYVRNRYEINSADIHYINSLAWQLATSPQADLRNYAEAAELARQIVDHMNDNNDQNPSGWGTIGVIYYRNQDYEAAIAALERSTSLNSPFPGFNYLVIAMAHWQRDEMELAQQFYDHAMPSIDELDEDDEGMIALRDEGLKLLESLSEKARQPGE